MIMSLLIAFSSNFFLSVFLISITGLMSTLSGFGLDCQKTVEICTLLSPGYLDKYILSICCNLEWNYESFSVSLLLPTVQKKTFLLIKFFKLLNSKFD